jgi:hypothetical protein
MLKILLGLIAAMILAAISMATGTQALSIDTLSKGFEALKKAQFNQQFPI